MLKKIGVCKIPIGVCEHLDSINSVNRVNHIKSHIISEVDDDEVINGIYSANGHLKHFTQNSTENTFIEFRNVSKHNDREFLTHKGYKDAAFFFLVIRGKFVVNLRGKTRAYKKGDVFVMNPYIDHSVTSKDRVCSVICGVIPKSICLNIAEEK